MHNYSPLRYPGGKAKVYGSLVNLLDHNRLLTPVYIEPYAGGAGLALKLLFRGDVSRVILNDIDFPVSCFWNSILDDSERFIDKIMGTPVNIEEWHKQKAIYENYQDYGVLDVGFAFFFLNRTNFSGILNAGPIGGRKQSGKYKLDCRFNKKTLIKQIENIASARDLIEFHNMDAFDFIRDNQEIIEDENTFTFIDPPYFIRGQELYLNFYDPSDHKALANLMRSIGGKWIITYDNINEIYRWYKEDFQVEFYDLNYSLNNKVKESELIIYSNRMLPVSNIPLASADYINIG